MTVETVTIDGQAYLVGLDWEAIPAIDASRSALAQAARARGLRFGYVREDPANEITFLGLSDRATAPAATIHLADARDDAALLFIAVLERETVGDPQRYWICALRNGVPDTSGDMVVAGSDALAAELRNILDIWVPTIGEGNYTVYTDSDAVARETGYERARFSDLVGGVAYADLPHPRQLVRDTRLLRQAATLVLLAGAASWGWITFMGADDDPLPGWDVAPSIEIQTTEQALAVDEEAILARADTRSPAMVAFIDAVAEVMHSYHASSRLEKILAHVDALPRYAGGWRLAEIDVAAGVMRVDYEREGVASLADLLRHLSHLRLTEMSADADRATFAIDGMEVNRSFNFPRMLEEARGQWPFLLDRLIRIEPFQVNFRPVLQEDVLQDVIGAEAQILEDPDVDDGILDPGVVEAAIAEAEQPLLERYRWRIHTHRARTNQLVDLLAGEDNIILINARLTFGQTAQIILEGAWYEIP